MGFWYNCAIQMSCSHHHESMCLRIPHHELCDLSLLLMLSLMAGLAYDLLLVFVSGYLDLSPIYENKELLGIFNYSE